MKPIPLLLLITFPALVSAQVTVKGVVTEQNSGNRPIAGVQIKALGATPEVTGNDGLFRLAFTGKKPGDRIIVSEISKPGFEIVNKDVVNSWLVPGDPELRTRIVMCPEGLIAENTLKYYKISSEGLNRAYAAQVEVLKQQKDLAVINMGAYREQANLLAEQFQQQQKQLEELAERFARENFDDCNLIHRQAFDAFQLGDIAEAIRILESVNSADEIAKAILQQSKAETIISEGQDMLVQSKEIIRQNIQKLMFQAQLYISEFRFAEADAVFETALMADTTLFSNLSKYLLFLLDQNQYTKGIRWVQTAMSAARSNSDSSAVYWRLAKFQYNLYQFDRAEVTAMEAIRLIRTALEDGNDNSYRNLSNYLSDLAMVQKDMKKYREAQANIREALEITKKLYPSKPERYADALATKYFELARIYEDMGHYEGTMENSREALLIWQGIMDARPELFSFRIYAAKACHSMGTANILIKQQYPLAESYLLKALEITKSPPTFITNNDKKEIAHLHMTMGYVQRRLENIEQANHHNRIALTLYRELAEMNPEGFQNDLIQHLRNMTVNEVKDKQYDSAAMHFSEALPLLRDLAKNQPEAFNFQLSELLYVGGNLYSRWDQPAKAVMYFDESAELLRNLAAQQKETYRTLLAQRLSDIACRSYNSDLEMAISYLTEAIEIYQQADSAEVYRNSLSECHEWMARFQLLSHKPEAAGKYARQAMAYSGNANTSRRYLAHSLLFQGKYDEAEKLYLQLSPDVVPWSVPKTFRELFLEDLDTFEKAGVTHTDVEKIRRKLAN